MGQSPDSSDFPIPARNCWAVSSDVHMFVRHVHIIYKFMFCMQLAYSKSHLHMAVSKSQISFYSGMEWEYVKTKDAICHFILAKILNLFLEYYKYRI
jgi:hypothetical protein